MMLKVSDVSVSYEGVTVLSNVSFGAERGDFIAVVGENGSGKSTLIRSLLGLTPLLSGDVAMSGVLPCEIGYLPQQTQAQKDFPASVDEVVMSGCLASLGFRPFYSEKERACADKNMKRLGIWEMRHRSYRDLSGGQQQRTLLARALCAAKKLLVLDEPAAGLDPLISADFASLLTAVNKEENMTIIVVSHDIKFAFENANKILHLGHGTYFFGTPDEYAKSEQGRRFMDYGGYAR